jgi:hypothetical protein
LFVILGLSFSMPAADRPIFVVQGPTIIALFSPLTNDDLKDGGNETLSDFRYYSGAARARLMDAGITLHEVYARSFRVRIGTSVTTFGFAKDQLGYYFVAPGKKPRVDYGIATDLEARAASYFGIALK